MVRNAKQQKVYYCTVEMDLEKAQLRVLFAKLQVRRICQSAMLQFWTQMGFQLPYLKRKRNAFLFLTKTMWIKM